MTDIDVHDMDDSHADGLDDNSDSAQKPSTSIRRACDACRTRKIRCDRNSPCSHCVHAKIPCTHADARPKEKRTRILLSAQYERKIDLIDRRLEGVTRLLQEMKTSMPSPAAQSAAVDKETPPSQPSHSSTSTPYGQVVHPTSDSHVVEGESSLAAHSVFANEFLHNAVPIDSLQGASLELRDTIDSLHHIVDALKQQTADVEMSYTMANPVPRPALPGVKLPPIQKTIALIRRAKTERSELGVWLFQLSPLEDFSETCLSVYFSPDYSEAEFIIANAGMYSLFWESAHSIKESEEKQEEMTYVNMVRTNLETALSGLPLHLPANITMISALLLGAYHAIEISKPSLSWTLTSKAGELCQTLGYHRISSMKKDKLDDKRLKLFVFWSVYFMDKSLSLRLGRASTIPDWDISVPMPKPDDFRGSSALSVFVVLWIWTARCQGNIYEKLYSPDAVSQPDHVRKDRVDSIVKAIEDIRVQTRMAGDKWAQEARARIREEMVQFISISDDVLRLSLLTLAYRASPPAPGSRTPFVPECIEAARATLQRHQDCINLVKDAHALYFHAYIHWTLLFAPFTPFIVLFCQVIQTQDERDLASLHSFIASTESAPTVSEAAGKMYRLFQVLYSVALRYIEFRTSTPPADQTQANAELNTYLAALGFPPVGPEHRMDQQMTATEMDQGQAAFAPLGDASGVGGGGGGMVDGAAGQNPMMWMGNTAQLEDWFNSNQQMMELLEEPSFTFPQ